MLEEVVIIVWVEERLDSIWTVYGSVGNVLSGIRKKIMNNSILHQYINRHFWGFHELYLIESFNIVRGSRYDCLSRRTAWFHVNCGL